MIFFWADGYCAKTKKDKNFKFSAFQRNIYRLNVYIKRFFVKNTGWPTDRRKALYVNVEEHQIGLRELNLIAFNKLLKKSQVDLGAGGYKKSKYQNKNQIYFLS